MASIIDTDRFRGRETASQGHGGDGGGGVDDILKRLGSVESAVADLRGDMREVMAVLPTLATKADLEEVKSDQREIRSVLRTVVPHLATKAEVGELRADIIDVKAELGTRIAGIEGELPHLATKENVAEVRTEVEAVKAQIHASEARIIRWFIATSITIAALTFSIARFVS
jgi:hypothetical protein